MRNAGLEEAQAGIKIARRNINKLRYAYYTTLMAESEKLKSLLSFSILTLHAISLIIISLNPFIQKSLVTEKS